MATDRVSGGDIPVDKLLAQLRRAAEQDGVDDVDAIVAEFATFVRAQAPRLATRQRRNRTHLSARTPLLATGALAAAAFVAVVSGAVANPFLPAAPSLASARAERAGALGTSAAGVPDPSVIVVADDLTGGDAPIVGAATAPSMTFTDPDALAVLAEQRSEGPVPPSPPLTTPTPPVTMPTSVGPSESDGSAPGTTPTPAPTPAPTPSNTTLDGRPGDGTAAPTVDDDPSDGTDGSDGSDGTDGSDGSDGSDGTDASGDGDGPARPVTSTTIAPLVDDDTQPVLQTTDLLDPLTDQGGAG